MTSQSEHDLRAPRPHPLSDSRDRHGPAARRRAPRAGRHGRPDPGDRAAAGRAAGADERRLARSRLGRTGFLASAYAAAAIVGAVPLTALTRSLPRRALLTGLLAGFALVNVVTALSSSYAVTLGVRLVAGLLGGLVWSMLAGYAARLVPARAARPGHLPGPGRRDHRPGDRGAGGHRPAGLLGWRGTFVVVGGLALGMMVRVRLGVPEVSGASRSRSASPVSVLRVRGVRHGLAGDRPLRPGPPDDLHLPGRAGPSVRRARRRPGAVDLRPRRGRGDLDDRSAGRPPPAPGRRDVDRDRWRSRWWPSAP